MKNQLVLDRFVFNFNNQDYVATIHLNDDQGNPFQVTDKHRAQAVQKIYKDAIDQMLKSHVPHAKGLLQSISDEGSRYEQGTGATHEVAKTKDEWENFKRLLKNPPDVPKGPTIEFKPVAQKALTLEEEVALFKKTYQRVVGKTGTPDDGSLLNFLNDSLRRKMAQEEMDKICAELDLLRNVE